MAEIFCGIVDAHRVRELAGIHAVVGIPETLELAEGLDELGAEHVGQQSRARLAVAVLAGERSAEGNHHVSGAIDKLAEFFYSFWSREVEVNTGVHAALAVVAVERAAEAVLGHELSDGAQIVAELRGRNGGVFPSLAAIGLAGHENHGAERGLAHMPNGSCFLGRADVRHRRGGPGLRGAGDGFGLGLRFFLGPRAHFDEQKTDSVRQAVEIAQRQTFAAHEIDQQIIEAFKADGLVFEGEGDGVGGEKGIAEAEHGEHAEGRAGDEVERGGDDVGAGAFRAHQRAGDVEVVFGQQLVEVVAGDAAGNARELFAHQGGVAVANAREARVDLAHAAAGADQRVQFCWRRCAHRHPGAVVENDVERFHVVDGFAAQQAVHAATVVADDAAEGAARMRGGVGRVGEVMKLGGVAQAVEHDAGLDARDPLRGV